MDDLFRLAVLAQQLDAELDMGPVDLAIDRLADVVQEPGALGDGDVDLELGRHRRGEEGHFLRMLQHVLSVRVAVAQPPHELDQLGVHAGNLELEKGGIAFLLDALLRTPP